MLDKTRETLTLLRFMQKFNLHNEVLNIIAFESPDFIVEFTNKKVGIEITSIYHNIQNKKRKDLINKIIDRSKNIFEINNSVMINLYINLLNPLKIRNNQIDNYCSDLVSHIQKLLEIFPRAQFPEINLNPYYNRNDKNYLLPWIDRIRITYLSGSTHSVWQHSESWIAGDLDVSFFKKEIKRKEKFISKYKNNADTESIWCLFIIDGSSSSDYAGISEVKNKIWVTEFDKIYIYDYWDTNNCYELKCCPIRANLIDIFK